MIAPRDDEQEYYVDHRHGLFYIRTNDLGKNFRVVTAPVEMAARSWKELIPLDTEAPLEDLTVRVVLRELKTKVGVADVDR